MKNNKLSEGVRKGVYNAINDTFKDILIGIVLTITIFVALSLI